VLILYFNEPMFAVESPSEVFQRLRNYVDALNCSALPSFAPKRLKQGFDNEMIVEASNKLKINKVSAYAIYFVLLPLVFSSFFLI